jgi:hypothetical protein
MPFQEQHPCQLSLINHKKGNSGLVYFRCMTSPNPRWILDVLRNYERKSLYDGKS